MNLRILIDAVVRQTTVLIAEFATAGGVRAPLAHVANQVFLDLSSELERQGVSRKVAADMFGLALRGYQRRIQRLTESHTEQGHSLWEAVFRYVSGESMRTRHQVLERFQKDDGAIVRGVLHDLVESGLLFSSGSGSATAYRSSTEQELGEMRAARGNEGLDELLWVLVYRGGPVTFAQLAELARVHEDEVAASLLRLEAGCRVRRSEGESGAQYTSGEFFVPLGLSAGWEAAVLDHFQAVVTTICAKLRIEPGVSAAQDRTGGSTYTFVVWPGHPHEDEVCGELKGFRERRSKLRTVVDAYNREHGIPARHVKVISYAGQCLLEDGPSNGVDEES